MINKENTQPSHKHITITPKGVTTMKYYIINIWNEKEECSIVEKYDDGTIRVHIPEYNGNGKYVGYREKTIQENELIIE